VGHTRAVVLVCAESIGIGVVIRIVNAGIAAAPTALVRIRFDWAGRYIKGNRYFFICGCAHIVYKNTYSMAQRKKTNLKADGEAASE
ncbi:MAG: hypothetical protein O6852_02220, partial [Gammaproteobacteria bacterium]|nr:hypothetical protein [Gammaproteobacteria bacterium]